MLGSRTGQSNYKRERERRKEREREIESERERERNAWPHERAGISEPCLDDDET